MPYIFISAVALCANLYRCAPLIVGDKFADPELMKFLGAKITTDYPEPNSPPMYVMFATMRSVMDALQEIGYELKSSQVVQGYTTWIMFKPLEGEVKSELTKSESAILPQQSTDEIQKEPETTAAAPRHSRRPRKKNKAVETENNGYRHCFELGPKEEEELRSASKTEMKKKQLTRSDSDYIKTDSARNRRPIPDVDESTSTRDLQSRSSKRLVASESGTGKDSFRRQIPEVDETHKVPSTNLRDTSSKRLVGAGSETPRTESSFARRQELEPKESHDDAETKSTESSAPPAISKKFSKRSKSSSDTDPPEKSHKHRGLKSIGKKSSTPVKENFRK